VEIAEKYKVPMMPFILKGVFGEAGSMQADGIHATAQGNQQVAKNILELLTPLLKKTHTD
jgi:acyl-CoA thioesterase-1